MTELIEADPGLLESIGPALACLTTTLPGCAASLKLLLERGVPLRIDPGEYNVLHEARAETARVVFQAGAADATGVAPTVHTGWPNNVSLLYWPAVFGGSEDAVEHVEVLLDYGADPEVRIQGNGERGNTVLQEAVSPYGPGQEGKRRVARKLIERGAFYDVLSACGLDDLKRVRECAREIDVITFRGEADMTPLHWAARSNALTCTRVAAGPGRRGRGAHQGAQHAAAPGGGAGRGRGRVAARRTRRRHERPGQEGPHTPAPGGLQRTRRRRRGADRLRRRHEDRDEDGQDAPAAGPDGLQVPAGLIARGFIL